MNQRSFSLSSCLIMASFRQRGRGTRGFHNCSTYFKDRRNDDGSDSERFDNDRGHYSGRDHQSGHYLDRFLNQPSSARDQFDQYFSRRVQPGHGYFGDRKRGYRSGTDHRDQPGSYRSGTDHRDQPGRYRSSTDLSDQPPGRHRKGDYASGNDRVEEHYSDRDQYGHNSNRGEGIQTTNRGNKHPPNLRGKAIGMFYAKRGAIRNQIKNRSNVEIDSERTKHLNKLLNAIECTSSTDDNQGDVAMEVEDGNAFSQVYNEYLDGSRLRNEGFHEVFVPDVQSLQRNQALDETLLKDFQQIKQTSRYQKMQHFRKKLPAYEMQMKILKLIEDNQVVVLSGETGCGKTTQVPQFILDSYLEAEKGSVCRIICTQPRRISAISVAERVAEERAETCGKNSSVGWQIRLEKKEPRFEGSILYCTTGILLQWLKSDSFLGNVSHIILDEVHERDLDTDFLMIILKDLLPRRRDLKLILMSATLNADMFSRYFGKCPMINIPGYTYPVREHYLEDVLEMTGYVPPRVDTANIPKWKLKRLCRHQGSKSDLEDKEPFYRSLSGSYSPRTINSLRDFDEKTIDINLIERLLQHICLNEKDGAILVFLPGWDDIRKLHNLLEENKFFSKDRYLILPLHSLMNTVNQREIFNTPPRGVRKIIIATNIAETSITIDDVVFVIDCGKMKMKNFDVEQNLETLEAEFVSLANAKQRRGRAGRVAPGICYHLYTRYREMTLDQYIAPEMLRTRLETLCLKIKIMNLGQIKSFLEKAMNPPNPKSVDISIELLKKLNALNDEECLTPLGFHLARLPMDPLTGRMILFGVIFSCLDPILTVAASLSFKDAFTIPLGMEKQVNDKKKQIAGDLRSDHLMLAKAFFQWEEACKNGNNREFCWENYLSEPTLKMLSKLKLQFAQNLKDLNFMNDCNPKNPAFNMYSDNEMVLKAVLCAGLYPNVAKVRRRVVNHKFKNRGTPLQTQTDFKVSFHSKSVNIATKVFPSEWVVYYLKMKSFEVYLYDTTMVYPYALLFFGGDLKMSVDQNGKEIVSVDDWIVFNCPAHTATIVMKLRKELDKLLQYKIEHPEDNSWLYGEKTKEAVVIKSIVDLIVSEDDPNLIEQLRNEKYVKKEMKRQQRLLEQGIQTDGNKSNSLD